MEVTRCAFKPRLVQTDGSLLPVFTGEDVSSADRLMLRTRRWKQLKASGGLLPDIDFSFAEAEANSLLQRSPSKKLPCVSKFSRRARVGHAFEQLERRRIDTISFVDLILLLLYQRGRDSPLTHEGTNFARIELSEARLVVRISLTPCRCGIITIADSVLTQEDLQMEDRIIHAPPRQQG